MLEYLASMMSCPSNTPSANAKIEPGQYGFRTSYPPLQKTGLNLSSKTEWQIITPKNTYVQSCYYEGELNTYPDREGIETTVEMDGVRHSFG